MTPAGGTASTVAGRGYATPRIPRRVSGPARKPATGRGAKRPAAPPRSFGLRVFERTQALADSRLLDRLVRGRLWIPLVAIALVGVVFMQVSMLRLNAGIGRDVQAISKLERENSVMQADVSRMEAGERIQSVARSVGMVVPADGGFHYAQALGARGGALAAQNMTPADPTALARATTQAQGTAIAQAQSQSPPPATTTTPGTGTATTATTATTPSATATTPASGTGAAPTTTSAPQPTSAPLTTAAPSTGAAPEVAAGGAAAPAGGQG